MVVTVTSGLLKMDRIPLWVLKAGHLCTPVSLLDRLSDLYAAVREGFEATIDIGTAEHERDSGGTSISLRKNQGCATSPEPYAPPFMIELFLEPKIVFVKCPHARQVCSFNKDLIQLFF